MDTVMDYFEVPRLANTVPTQRAAYSDRTAWMLAEMSRLAYEQHATEPTVEAFAGRVKAAVESGADDEAVAALLKQAMAHRASGQQVVDKALQSVGYRLLREFSVDGTDGFIAIAKGEASTAPAIVVAFRGTEACAKDIGADMKARLVEAQGGGRVHEGFEEAYSKVSGLIQRELAAYPDSPVYICGHSLGGAMALLATRYLGSTKVAATYTYGCPRVADDTFFEPVRSPVYRIVNAADIVTRLPFGPGVAVPLAVLRYVPVNGTKALSEWIRRRFLGYTHYGNLAFLSAPANEVGQDGIGFKDLVLKMSPNIFWRVHVVLPRLFWTRGRAAATDHSIMTYCRKLEAYAMRRNPN